MMMGPKVKDLAEAIERGVPASALLALFKETPEWKPSRGAEVLDSVLRFVRRFVSLTEAQGRTITLWTAHTHAFEAADCTPYLAVNSAEKQSGKTRLLEVLRFLVFNAWFTGRVSAAVLTRKIDAVCPTLLLDESDAAFGSEKEYAEVLRGILNTGYRRGGVASCCVGQGANISYKDFSTFCPKVIAGIGKLPDTVADRSIPIRLKRARRGEVEKFREREVESQAGEIKAEVAAWCAVNLEKLRVARPDILPELSDRQADCCEPLLAIADLAVGDWPEKTRAALVALCTEGQADDQSIGARLLADIRQIFEGTGVDRIGSAELVESLAAIETSPWAEWCHGKPITPPRLARLLNPFGIAPDSVRFGSGTRKGYQLEDFVDAFDLYLSPQKRNNGTKPINTGENEVFEGGTATAGSVAEDTLNPNKDAVSSVVPVSTPQGEPQRTLFEPEESESAGDGKDSPGGPDVMEL